MKSISEIVEDRGIEEVLHFTTNHGLIGVLASKCLKSRTELNEDDYLSNVKLMNCADRRDSEWVNFVSLSISVANIDFLRSSTSWHPPGPGLWWAVLSFSPEILSHSGVTFATTNNVYHEVVKRGMGPTALEDLFAHRIAWGYYGSSKTRPVDWPSNCPTDLQAEVLYPGGVSLSYLKAIYVMNDDNIDDVRGIMASVSIEDQIAIEARPEVFR